MSGEADERLAAGPRGAKGAQGEQGQRGLSRRVSLAVVVLFAIPLILAGFAIFWVNHEVSANNHKFCEVIAEIVPVPRPADPKANPSRETAWEQYEGFEHLGRSLGC